MKTVDEIIKAVDVPEADHVATWRGDRYSVWSWGGVLSFARMAIEAALKEREGEAIHQVYMDGGWHDKIDADIWMYGDLPEHDKRIVYTAPPKAQPMTREQIQEMLTAHFADDTLAGDDMTLIRAVERHHKIGD